MSDAGKRSESFSGVWHIVLYNWHFYVAAIAIDVLAVYLATRPSAPIWLRVPVYGAALVATVWGLSSLLVSHYVYDRSRLYQWDWLREGLKSNPESWANLHAGLDESTDALIRMFPDARRKVLDIYTAAEMSEPSIARARQRALHGGEKERKDSLILPLDAGECDTIFLIFVAHELRRREARVQLFHEVTRALTAEGKVVLVEHLRNWRNFFAYGPGAMHFFSRREWLSVGAEAGLKVIEEMRIAVFVRCFVFAKCSDGRKSPRDDRCD